MTTRGRAQARGTRLVQLNIEMLEEYGTVGVWPMPARARNGMGR